MTVTAVTPPVPANADIERAMTVWSGTSPITGDTATQNLLNFCSAQNVNLVYLDIWSYLGGSNYNATNVGYVEKFIQYAHLSGIRVMAMAGNSDWGKSTLYTWVLQNILQKLQNYQSACTNPHQMFDGLVFDVEYWTDNTQTASVACAGLCDLMNTAREVLAMPGGKGFQVGCFTSFFLKDSTGTRATFSFQGKTAQDGEFLMDNADFVVDMAYRNHAADNGTDGPGIDTLHAPWNTYATGGWTGAPAIAAKAKLYVGVETTNSPPAYTTFYGGSKAAMEAELTTVSGTFRVSGGRAYYGACVDSYDGWKALT